jgi:hypothetical protein
VSESWNFILKEMLDGSLNTIFNLLKVLIPLMVVIQLLIVYNVLEKISTKLEFLGKPMGITKNAMFPLLVGVFMGVTYGAGTLIELNKQKPLGRRDFLLIGIFMVLCHGIIEAAFLFGVAGASVVIVVVVRLLIAFVITCICARLPYFRRLDN